MKNIKKFISALVPDKSDILLFSGLASLGFGVYQINKPASFIVIGILLIIVGFIQVLPVPKEAR